MSAGGVIHRAVEEYARPVAVLGGHHISEGVLTVAAAHHQQMLDGHGAQVVIGIFNRYVLKVGENLIVNGQKALALRDADEHGGEGLGAGIHGVRGGRSIGREVVLEEELSAPPEQHGMNIFLLAPDGREHIGNGGGAHALGFGRSGDEIRMRITVHENASLLVESSPLL